MRSDTMLPDEFPVVSHAQPRAVGHWKAAICSDGTEFIAVCVRVYRWHRICAFRTDERQFVEVGVATGGDAVAMSRPWSMNFDIQAEGLGEVGYLHRAGNAEIVFGIGANEIGRLVDDEIRLRLHTAHVLGLQQRRLDELSQLPVEVLRPSPVAHRILVPEEARFVAGATDRQRIRKGAQLAGGIEHQIHPPAKMLTQLQHSIALFLQLSVAPAVHIECAITNLVTLLRYNHDSF